MSRAAKDSRFFACFLSRNGDRQDSGRCGRSGRAHASAAHRRGASLCTAQACNVQAALWINGGRCFCCSGSSPANFLDNLCIVGASHWLATHFSCNPLTIRISVPRDTHSVCTRTYAKNAVDKFHKTEAGKNLSALIHRILSPAKIHSRHLHDRLECVCNTCCMCSKAPYVA